MSKNQLNSLDDMSINNSVNKFPAKKPNTKVK